MLGGRRRSTLAALCLASCALSAVSSVSAQPVGTTSPDSLAAARSLFAEALHDEEAKRFSDALQKYQRVRAVRDTASIEYRIGSCYEGLGRPVPAYLAYRDAMILGLGDAQASEVVRSATDRLQLLAKRVARLTLALPERPLAYVEVRVDDALVSPAAMHDGIVLEPGPHVVTATASDAAPFRSETVLPAGVQGSLTISFEPREGPILPRGGPTTVSREVQPSPTAPTEGAPVAANRTPAWLSMAGGGSLLIGSTVLLLIRQAEISKLNHACPLGLCPSSDRNDLESTRDRALLEGPVAIALGAGGLVAVGIGTYLLVTSDDTLPNSRPAGACIVPFLASGAGGVVVAGMFP